jgi:colicin import membrane protein
VTALASALTRRRERLWPLLVVSLALHASVVALAVLHQPAPVIDLEQKPIVAKLVRLGERRPPGLLPRKEADAPAAPAPGPPVAVAPPAAAAPPQPSPPAKVAVAAPATKTPPKPRPTQPAASGTPQSSSAGSRPDPLAAALARVRREQVLGVGAPSPYGDPAGDPEGDSSEGSAGDHYLALAVRAIHSQYRLPTTISERDRVHLRATVVLFVEPDGTVSRHLFEKRSGNAAFDDALERAIRSVRLPPPPTELRETYRRVGLGVNFHM